jgi:hypothetical protein
MSERPNTPPDSLGGPIGRPQGDGLPPVDQGRQNPDGGDVIDPGEVQGNGDRGQDVPGLAGER